MKIKSIILKKIHNKDSSTKEIEIFICNVLNFLEQ